MFTSTPHTLYMPHHHMHVWWLPRQNRDWVIAHHPHVTHVTKTITCASRLLLPRLSDSQFSYTCIIMYAKCIVQYTKLELSHHLLWDHFDRQQTVLCKPQGFHYFVPLP